MKTAVSVKTAIAPLSRHALAGNLPRDIMAGVVASLLTISNCFTYAALIFSGTLQPFLGQGVAVLLISGAVTASVIALTSGFRGVVSGPIASTSALLAAMLAGQAPALAGHAPAVVLATVYAALGMATLATGIALLAIGTLRLGKIVRFVPYPVMAGFMGATGWVMVTGAVHMSTDVPLTLSAMSRFAGFHSGVLLIAVLGFAAMLFLLTRRVRHPLTIPLALMTAACVTDAGLYLAHDSFASARAAGLLFSMVSGASMTVPLLSGALFQADWAVVAHAAAGVAPVVVVGLLQALVMSTGLELTRGTEADLDRELRSQGSANVASALLGGVVGFVSMSYTTLSTSAGGRGRASGVVVGLLTLAALGGGAAVIGYIPRFALGGLLFMLGARMLWDWGFASRHRMPFREYLLTVAIIVITAVIGLLPALLTGVLGGCVLLALSMSGFQVVRRRCGVNERPSSLQRSEEEMLVLASHGDTAQVLELGGFIFFGSAYQLYEQVKDVLDAGTVQILALDFSAVIGSDASAIAILERIQSLVRKAGLLLIVSGLNDTSTRLLHNIIDPAVPRWATLDEAIEAAEEAVLRLHAPPPGAPRVYDWLAHALGDADLARELAASLSVTRFREGDVVCRQGEAADTLHFIESGRISVLVEMPGQPPTRVRVFGRQTVAGELGFFLGTTRTATLRVERDASVGSLDRAAFQRLSTERPALVLALLSYLIRVGAERLSFATRQIVTVRR